jgi:hypothetical protein
VADPVIFDRSSAERIANAVRRVEIGDRTESPLRFDTVPPPQQRRTFRIATFTGSWAINATKTVTFKYQTSTPNTASAINLFAAVPAPSGAADCAIARDGTAWFLIEWFQPTTTAVVTVLTGVTLTTAGLQFTRATVTVQSSATVTITTIGTTAC